MAPSALRILVTFLAIVGCNEDRKSCSESCRRTEIDSCGGVHAIESTEYRIKFYSAVAYEFHCVDDVGKDPDSSLLSISGYNVGCDVSNVDDTEWYSNVNASGLNPVPKECAGTIEQSPYSYSGTYSDETKSVPLKIYKSTSQDSISTINLECAGAKASEYCE